MRQRRKNLNVMLLLHYRIPFFFLKVCKRVDKRVKKRVNNTFFVEKYDLKTNLIYLGLLWSPELTKYKTLHLRSDF